ncbi:MAG: hypothetical protein ACRDX8_04290 [Acidimicrobiales bacterium]
MLEEREGAQVAEISPPLHLPSGPEGSRVLVRREEPHPRASYNLSDPKGLRHQAMITNSKDCDMAFLEARHRLLARVEDRIKEAKELGLRNVPCARFRTSLLLLVHLAQDLLAWARRSCLPTEFWKGAPEQPRYQVLHVAERLARAAGGPPCGSMPALCELRIPDLSTSTPPTAPRRPGDPRRPPTPAPTGDLCRTRAAGLIQAVSPPAYLRLARAD